MCTEKHVLVKKCFQMDYKPKLKRHSIEWKYPESLIKKKFQAQLSAKKAMLTVFWSMIGPIAINGSYQQNIF